jgi:transposase
VPEPRLSDVVYRQLVADNNTAVTALDADPGGHCGATQESSAADLPPRIDTSDKPLPGPAQPTLRRDPDDVKNLVPSTA